MYPYLWETWAIYYILRAGPSLFIPAQVDFRSPREDELGLSAGWSGLGSLRQTYDAYGSYPDYSPHPLKKKKASFLSQAVTFI